MPARQVASVRGYRNGVSQSLEIAVGLSRRPPARTGCWVAFAPFASRLAPTASTGAGPACWWARVC